MINNANEFFFLSVDVFGKRWRSYAARKDFLGKLKVKQ